MQRALTRALRAVILLRNMQDRLRGEPGRYATQAREGRSLSCPCQQSHVEGVTTAYWGHVQDDCSHFRGPHSLRTGVHANH
jgi:hypothetical protein